MVVRSFSDVSLWEQCSNTTKSEFCEARRPDGRCQVKIEAGCDTACTATKVLVGREAKVMAGDRNVSIMNLISDDAFEAYVRENYSDEIWDSCYQSLKDLEQRQLNGTGDQNPVGIMKSECDDS